MMGRRSMWTFAVGAASLLCAPSPSFGDILQITAKGTIPGSCTLGSGSSFAAADFSAGGTRTATALVNCNQAFRMNALSTQGAVRTAASAPANFTNALAYSLKVDLPVDGGAVITATCGSATLVAGQSACPLSPANTTGLSSGGQIATQKIATLTLSWSPPATPRLLAGSYSDTITLSIAPVP